MDMTAKKRNGLRMKHQNSASSVSRSFLLISRQSLVFVAGCPTSVWSAGGKVFGLNTLRRRKILPETALPPDLVSAIKPCATFASEHRERVSDGMDSIIPAAAFSAIRNKQRNPTSTQFANYKLSEQQTLSSAYSECNGYNHFKAINVVTDSIGLLDILHCVRLA